MTFKEWLIEQLTGRGFWPKDAETVFEVIKYHPTISPMKYYWGNPVADYSESLKSAVWIIGKPIALEWIDMNQPEALYRSMFVE